MFDYISSVTAARIKTKRLLRPAVPAMDFNTAVQTKSKVEIRLKIFDINISLPIGSPM